MFDILFYMLSGSGNFFWHVPASCSGMAAAMGPELPHGKTA
jgi:hypothetical protein